MLSVRHNTQPSHCEVWLSSNKQSAFLFSAKEFKKQVREGDSQPASDKDPWHSISNAWLICITHES